MEIDCFSSIKMDIDVCGRRVFERLEMTVPKFQYDPD